MWENSLWHLQFTRADKLNDLKQMYLLNNNEMRENVAFFHF